MADIYFSGPLIRMLRLNRNWSQKTLCHGICTVSYLSKIEQGKAEANEHLLSDLFERLGVEWKVSPDMTILRDELYEGIFSWDDEYTRKKILELEKCWDDTVIGPNYIDFLVIRAYFYGEPELLPKEFEDLPDVRQRAVLLIARNQHGEAYRLYPCPLTAFCVGEEAFQKGNYTQALEYFQITYDQAAQEGYVHLMLYSQHYMANCCSDMGNLDAMYRHSRIAARLAQPLGRLDILDVIQYNIAATKAEFGDYEGAFAFFSNLKEPDAMALHKLAVCCEAMGKKDEAFSALDRAEDLESSVPLKYDMCRLVRYRLEHQDYLQDPIYGEMLMKTFENMEKELHPGFIRFHLRWITEWLTANRQYRKAYEILQKFPYYKNLSLP